MKKKQMMQMLGNPVEETRDSPSIPKSVIPSNLITTMDLKTPTCLKSPSFILSNKESSTIEGGNSGFYRKSMENPFADDPLCKLNLKETSEFDKALPMTSSGSSSNSNESSSRDFLEQQQQQQQQQHKRCLEAPPTPGRPVFSFSVGSLSRKSFPSKWDDAEKWLMSSSTNSGHDSPGLAPNAHYLIRPPPSSKITKKQIDVFQPKGGDYNFSMALSSLQACVPLDQPSSAFNGGGSAQVLLKDKFTDDDAEPIFPNYKYSEPTKEKFVFRSAVCETMKNACTEVVPPVQHRDVGTEMTPLGSSTTSRCHTPFKISSPARHNTPANISGPLANTAAIDIAELQECHFARLELELGTQFDSVVSNWSSRKEEEAEISKSLRHFDTGKGCRPNNIAAESKASAWEEEEKTKSCIRYQREAARIQAWVNLQNAKAEAQSRKLEVKIEKMRSNLEEKLLKRMAIVNRKAEEMRGATQLQHSQQIQRASAQAQRMKNRQQHNSYYISDRTSCGCFPCNNHHF